MGAPGYCPKLGANVLSPFVVLRSFAEPSLQNWHRQRQLHRYNFEVRHGIYPSWTKEK